MSNKIKANTTGKWLKLVLLFHFALIPFWMMAQQSKPETIIKTSCSHKSLKPKAQYYLDSQISEGSGLIIWNGQLWTHNDSGTPRIFALDSSNGKIVRTYDLPGVKNEDWEDMSQDEHSLYVGNFGNNAGKRDSLQIYRISKEALVHNKIVLDSISFEWPAISNSGKTHKENFNCEAMIVVGDTIFLFTKEWKWRYRSMIFKIPATAGNHIAEYVATIRPHMLVTGASYSVAEKRIVLCGYNLLLAPRLVVLSIPDSGNFKNIGKGKKIKIRTPLRQVEGVTGFGNDYYLISEATHLILWRNKPKLYRISIE
jgi:hypothetical protein